MRLSRLFPLLLLAAFMGGCASMTEGPTQNVTLQTPGAAEAECHLTNGVKYRAATGETLRIMRSHRDLVVDCYAAGNRHKQVIIKSAFNEWGLANATNGVVPGAAYDHFSGALYAYPPMITVDFVGVPTYGFETPAYHNKDAPNPYKQSIESYGAGTPAVPMDSEYLKRGLDKRDVGLNSNPFSSSSGGNSGITPMPSSGGSSSVPAMTPSKPNLSGRTADELTRSANPSVFNQ